MGKKKSGGGGGADPIAVRSDFNPLAAFAPAEVTDADGETTVEVDMPDNLTRYRIMAVAVNGGTDFGSAEDNVTARLPLMVRPSAPRFLNFGDQVSVPLVLQNQTDEKMDVKVATRATNLKWTGDRGLSVEVPADDRVEVQFPAETDRAGTTRMQFAASSEAGEDAARVELPVRTPATGEAFATYGTIDKGAKAVPVKKPGEVWEQFGGLEVTTSSTALQALTDAFLYLYEYDYACSEQLASRMISVAALRDVLDAFDAEGMPSKDKVRESMENDIEELAGRQNRRGGFGLWRAGRRSWPYASLHVIHALVRARQKGYEVPRRTLQQGQHYLQNVERYIPSTYPEWVRRTIVAYSLYVRDLVGDTDVERAKKLYATAGGPKNLSFEAQGWLLNVMSGDASAQKELKAIRKHLNNRVTETAAGAHFATRYSDRDYLIMQSDRRADGIILEALIEDQPDSDLIPKIVRGLLAHRKKGRWGNTQENTFVLLALDRYFREYEDQTPDFVARMWLGDQYAGEHAFEGRTTERHRVKVPMRQLAEQGDEEGKSTLTIQKDGDGRLYYRVGMEYAPKSLDLDPADHGFVVEREYEAVDEDDDVRRRDDGTWEIEAGARVRVRLEMVAPTRRYHVALVDPLPAGLEAINPELAVTGSVPADPQNKRGRYWWFHRPWYEHQNMRDDRVEAFSSLVRGGVHEYTYYARATTPGTFVVPPAKAEEMYHPETFGRAGTATVVVEP